MTEISISRAQNFIKNSHTENFIKELFAFLFIFLLVIIPLILKLKIMMGKFNTDHVIDLERSSLRPSSTTLWVIFIVNFKRF